MTDTEQQYARCFSSPSGAAVLAHLRDITINRVMSPDVSDNRLRWVAAQCALVRQIESMISHGRGDKK
jgi:hypothetical protein